MTCGPGVLRQERYCYNNMTKVNNTVCGQDEWQRTVPCRADQPCIGKIILLLPLRGRSSMETNLQAGLNGAPAPTAVQPVALGFASGQGHANRMGLRQWSPNVRVIVQSTRDATLSPAQVNYSLLHMCEVHTALLNATNLSSNLNYMFYNCVLIFRMG